MKKIVFAVSVFSLGLGLVSCRNAKGDYPGDAYMPDMYYSRAYEAYNYNDVGGERDSLHARGVAYNGLPVIGTVARGDMLPYHLTEADTAGSRGLQNPLTTLRTNTGSMAEAERLYLVNCGICHGPALDGNGPLYKGGEGPYPAAPRPLNGDYAKALSDGSIYHTITFGKGAMGSYASQLRPEQRWMVIDYIRNRQTTVDGGDASAPEQAQAAATQSSAKTDTSSGGMTQQPK